MAENLVEVKEKSAQHKLADELVMVDLRGKYITRMNELGQKWKRIQRLDLQDNELRQFGPYTADQCASLVWLELAKNKLHEIVNQDPQIRGVNLVLMVNLTRLSLLDNGLLTIQHLSHLKKLRFLDLSVNSIEVIEGLDELVELEYLLLRLNRIKRIDNLSTLTKLRSLDLSRNYITKWENLEALTSLERLKIYKNDLRKMDDFTKLPELKFLIMDDTNIKTIYVRHYWDPDTMEDVPIFPKLEFLSIKFNTITNPLDFAKLACFKNLVQVEENSLLYPAHKLLPKMLPKVRFNVQCGGLDHDEQYFF